MPSLRPSRVSRPYVSVQGRYRRSVDLRRDFEDPQALDGYLATPTVEALATRILQELADPSGVRAWSITGPYGTGKSSFALFLARLLARDDLAHTAAKKVVSATDLTRPMLPLLLVGQRRALKPTLMDALRKLERELPDGLSKIVRADSLGADPSDEEVAAAYERAAQASEHAGYGGLAVFVDEFGKFLEHVAANPADGDIQVVQFMAEAATRSSSPFLFTTILHSSFSSYVRNESDLRQAEWQKVQGRFVDLAFQEPFEQLLRLVGNAIRTEFPPDLHERLLGQIKWIRSAPSWGEVRERFAVGTLLPACLPLEPTTALVLGPLFRSKLAQNERSLLSFLVSDEPRGFQDFVRSADWSKEPAPLFGLDDLYDYVASSLGPTAYQGELARRWIEIENAISRVQADAPPRTRDVVKAVGLLSMYGAHVGLQASEDALSHAFGDHRAVSQVLEYLLDRSIVVHRAFQDAFALWEGSDVDLDEQVAKAHEHVRADALAARLWESLDLTPVAANAHYIEKGTLRFFEVRVIDGTRDGLAEALEMPIGHADGLLTYVLTDERAARSELIQQACEATKGADKDHSQRVFAFPRPLAGLESALRDFEAWRWVHDHTPALDGDLVAAREVSVNLELARRRLEDRAGGVFGLRGHRFDPAMSDWVYLGDRRTFAKAKEMSRWLSSIFDDVFSMAPTFYNELLNRRVTSSAANTALNKLARAIVAHSHEPQLGIEGFPPELSMYESLLRRGGFHRFDEELGEWRLDRPSQEWMPAWQHMEAFLESTEAGKRKISEVFDDLVQPPFGLRRGVLPLLALLLLRYWRNSVAVYYGGLYQPELTAPLAEQLLRNPDTFEVKRFRHDSETEKLLEELSVMVDKLGGSGASRAGESPILRVARPLIMFAARLPKYTKATRRLDPPEAADICVELTQAVDPHRLVVDDIPSLLKIWPTDEEGRKAFVSRLDTVLQALQTAYPNLLERIGGYVARAFGIDEESSDAIRDALRRRAEPVKGFATDPKVVAIVNRLLSPDDASDWREGVGLTVNSKAPREWRDSDEAEFQTHIYRIAREFRVLEEMVREHGHTGAQSVLRIGVLREGGADQSALVSVVEQQTPEVAAIMAAIGTALGETAGGQTEARRKARIAALTGMLLNELEEMER